MKVGVFQMTSTVDYRENLDKLNGIMGEVKEQGVKALFLPECFYSMSDGTAPTPFLIKRDNEHYQNIKSLAKDNGIYILGGTAAAADHKSIKNRAFNFDPKGRDLGIYDKIHLFSCKIIREDREVILNEQDLYSAGSSPRIIHAEEMTIGLGICVDLRYPEMSRKYAQDGVNVLTYASAFTVPTGEAHWHILVRARAIENQVFVIAPAQWGRNNQKIHTYGHSLIVDPWGKILVDAKEGEKLITAELDFKLIEKVRNQVVMEF